MYSLEKKFSSLWACLFISVGDFCQGTLSLTSFPEVNPFLKQIRKNKKKRLIIAFKKLETIRTSTIMKN